jgi:hypothetical protein
VSILEMHGNNAYAYHEKKSFAYTKIFFYLAVNSSIDYRAQYKLVCLPC